ncbi:MAG: amino acid-binding protein [Actinomycetota bacterium]
MLFTLRISIPDQPGTLGAVASAFGNGGANILTLDVVEREDGFAVDDLYVEAPAGMQKALQSAIEAVPGLAVEDVRPAEAFRDMLASMELAAVLAETAGADAVGKLVENLPDALWANWSVALIGGPDKPEVLASSIGAPSMADITTPWLPLEAPRRLATSHWAPPGLPVETRDQWGQAEMQLVAAPLYNSNSAVLVGRRSGPRFRNAELRQLGQLSRIAAAVSSSKAPTPLNSIGKN